ERILLQRPDTAGNQVLPGRYVAAGVGRAHKPAAVRTERLHTADCACQQAVILDELCRDCRRTDPPQQGERFRRQADVILFHDCTLATWRPRAQLSLNSMAIPYGRRQARPEADR